MYDSIRNKSNNTNITVSFRLNYSNNYSKYSSPTASPFSTNIKHTGIFDNYSFNEYYRIFTTGWTTTREIISKRHHQLLDIFVSHSTNYAAIQDQRI